MKVITIYEAFDGKKFEDEFECLTHEMDILELTSDIQIYGKHNKKLHVWYSDATYNQCTKIVLPSESSIQVLKRIQDFAGFFCDIPPVMESIGIWRFNNTTEQFEKSR